MKIFKLHIMRVDGLGYYEICSCNPSEVNEFGEDYDHEGSSISLEVIENYMPSGKSRLPEKIQKFISLDVYARLEEEIRLNKK